MTEAQGLCKWRDGPCSGAADQPTDPPLVEQAHVDSLRLWVVGEEDVLHAEEQCEFGRTLATRCIKHTNLTGGQAAYSGGELVFINERTIVVNGCSGRYGPRDASELRAAAAAFSASGYRVWSMGFDDETAAPRRFVGILPELVA